MVAAVHFVIVGLVLVNKGVNPMVSSKALEGYPTGYLGNCPGSTKPAIVMKKSMKYVGMLVVGPGGRKTKYGYHQAKNIAKHPAIDFKKRDTVMFIGGFMDSPNFFPSATMGNEYKKRGYNVLLMEANRFLTMHYPISARYMRPIGKILAEMLSNLTDSGLDPKRFHLIGVSLGGQTVSYIAKNFYRITGQKVARITALDPSGPCFRNLGPEDRLDQSDADFVDVIQTNIDGFGMAAPVGHVNIYVNGGEYQPGDVYWMPCSTLCSHVRVYTLWISALQHPDKFIAIKCDSVQQARNLSCYDNQPMATNIMGMKVDRSKPGIYYLATGNNYPYFLGKDGMRKENEFWGKNLGEFNSDDVMKMK